VDWFARDYSVPIHTNALGFRDREHEQAKPAGVVRIALLGDSLVEALQVPLDQTAGALLEARLNAAPDQSARYEVLNFGISNYGVGQCLLVWETYASRFAPDYVFILVGAFHFDRTVMRYELGRFHHDSTTLLWIRPTFRLEIGALIREPAADYDQFVAAQRALIDGELEGARSRRRETSVVAHLIKQLRGARPPAPGSAAARGPGPGVSASGQALIDVNLRIIDELRAQVAAGGGRLVVVDACAFFGGRPPVCQDLARFCTERDVGYVALSPRLRAANAAGRATRWADDGHFNETGNEVFAESMYDWLREQRGMSR
jgi:hypothetical protein